MTVSGFVSRTLERLAPATGGSGRENTAELAPTCCDIVNSPLRERVQVRGVIDEIVVRPAQGVTLLEVRIDDGSDQVTLVWLGRDGIQGVELGRSLTAHGRIGDHDGRKIIYNPAYELDA